MIDRLRRLFACVALLACSGLARAAPDASFDAALLLLQQAWARTNYEVPAGDARKDAFNTLEQRAAAFVKQYPTRAEPLIWEGIIESSSAGARGGLGALTLCRQARAHLEDALAIDPDALDGSAYTSLGALYYKVPGFPLGFGDDRKAEKLLQRALKVNPDGIDPNYFYAEYLFEQGRYDEALRHLDRAGKAAPRPGRELADKGRRDEIAALAEKVRSKQG
jgi:tetratricopeptide (TPR) repeat protein